MKETIRRHINEPGQLESLYRSDKSGFRQAFRDLYPELQNIPLATFWQERLQHKGEGIHWGGRREWLLVFLLALLAGISAKLPVILGVSEDFFYPRNVGFTLFTTLTIYFSWKNQLPKEKVLPIALLTLSSIVYINLLPENPASDTLVLAYLHLLVILWGVFGYSHAGGEQKIRERWLSFLKFNGDLLVMGVPIAIAGGLLTGITLGLFSVIGLDIEKFYTEYILIFGLASLPIISTYLIQTNPQVVGKISQVIASLFSPLVLLMLVIYLVAILYSGKDPYNDRDFLILFNALLVGVLALIFFSISGFSSVSKKKLEIWILALLAGVTILVNAVALSAIVFRLAEWGITPNRMAVLGGNVWILIHLLLVSWKLIGVLREKTGMYKVEKVMVSYLPVYFIWALLVTLLFPFLFGFA
ncbi:hypothetical protein [Cyclobacterium roseum]|uniref:hypothetical protein n=1 Tax=Cyclobacterium roseum TaxID=2666137 RepID=UPI00139179EB|nr:hypothetical protein [Cyclobacterium roseum]